ncbi:hypothetical protein [Microbacterium gilvum]|uniref:Minor tail protein n=1 Tax=Microbacterium gilvum TaxID=1336204 RepID=A0ABP9A6F6_9MICO
MWRFYVHDTISGARLVEVFPSAGSWARRLTGQGQGQHTFVLTDSETGFSRATWRDLLRDNARTLLVCWEETPVYAGMILSSAYDRSTRTVTVSHTEIRHIFKQRLTFGVNQYVNGDLTITNKNANGVVRAILQRATQWSSEWALPLDLPENESGTLSRSWKKHQVLTIEDLLGSVEEEGYEIEFRPALTSGVLRWSVRVGRPISGGFRDFNLTAPECPITDLKMTSDGSKRLTGVFVSGNGTGPDMVTNWAGSTTGNTIPIRDAYESSKDTRNATRLGEIAAAFLDLWDLPIEQYSFKIQLGDETPNAFFPGERVYLESQGDPWMNDGRTTLRVIALSGDMSLAITPEVQI